MGGQRQPYRQRHARSPAAVPSSLQVRSLRCGFVDAIAAMLAEDPRVPATVIAQRLRLQGFAGSVTILKDQST
jgi:hypothetical protein